MTIPKIQKIKDTSELSQLLLKYLPEKDQLAVRQTNSFYKNLLKNNSCGPYQTKASFAMATTGTFLSQSYFNKAWEIYHATLTSTSMKPALLYKLIVHDLTRSRMVHEPNLAE